MTVLLLEPWGEGREAGGVLDELLLGGSTQLGCVYAHLYKALELQVIYTPAGGELAGRKCKLAPSFIEEFLRQPRPPRRDEHRPIPVSANNIDLACASGHLPMARMLPALDSDGRRRAAAEDPPDPRIPPSLVAYNLSRNRRATCGMRNMEKARAWQRARAEFEAAAAAAAATTGAADSAASQKAGQGRRKRSWC